MAFRIDFKGKGPVLFEGAELPMAVKGFDHLPFWVELDDEIRDWLFDLHYCWGRVRECPSKDIRRYVRVVREKLKGTLSQAQQGLREAFPECDEAGAEETLGEWFDALELMERLAQQTTVCRWTVTATDEDLEANLAIAIGIVRDGVRLPESGKRVALVDNLKPGFEFRVRSLARDKQLELLAMIADSLSDKRPSRFTRFCGRLLNVVRGNTKRKVLAYL